MLGALLGGIGSIASSLIGAGQANKQAKLQKQFAQNGIQWKVEDAKAAGVHPLYALGANTVSYQPTSVGGPDLSWLGSMGQEIDRSRLQSSEAPVREAGRVVEKLSLERAGLENDLLRAQIAKTRAQTAPAMPGLVPETTNDPTRTTGLNAGVGYRTNPAFVDASSFEDRYGDSEILAMGVGAMNGAADFAYNFPALQKRALDYINSQPYWVKKWPNAGVGRFAGRR